VVLVVWLCEILHIICICHSLYFMIVSDYGNPITFVNPPKTFKVAISSSAIIGPVVQVFFAYRVRVVSNRLAIPIICWILSSIWGVFTLIAMGESLVLVTLQLYEIQWKWILTAAFALGAGVDFIVAVNLLYYLNAHKSNSSTRTTSIIDKFITWTVQTGLLTSLTATAMLITFLIMPTNFLWLGIFTFQDRLFSCALMASLNGRTFSASDLSVGELPDRQDRLRAMVSAADVEDTHNEVAIKLSELKGASLDEKIMGKAVSLSASLQEPSKI